MFCFLCVLILITPLAGCRIAAPVSVPTPVSSTIENTAKSSPSAPVNTPEIIPTPTPEEPSNSPIATPEANIPSPMSMMDIGEVVYYNDLGLSEISNEVYWVPGKNSVFFQGYTKDAEGKTASGVYYYDIDKKEIKNILTINGGSDYFLSEPSWSSDSNEVVFSFLDLFARETPAYVYNITQGTLELLPFSPYGAEFSPDGSKIIYNDRDKNLWVYTRSTKSSQALGTSIKGHSPIWFSDNRHILFFNATGKNPHNLDGADLYTICIFDTLDMQITRIIEEEAVYQSVHWLIQDRLAWIESGWDDGHFANILDLSDNSIEDLGEFYYQPSMPISGAEPRLIKSIDQNQWRVYDAVQNRGYEYLSSPYQGQPVGMLPDQTLLLLQTEEDFSLSSLIAVPRDDQAYILAQYENSIYPYVNEDSTRFAFMNPNESLFIFTDAMDLYKKTMDESEVPPSEAEFMNSLLDAINNENIDVLKDLCYSVYGTISPEEIESLPLGLGYFRLHFNNEKLVDYVLADSIKYRSDDSQYLEDSRYFLISESGIWREVQIRRQKNNLGLTYKLNEQLFNSGTYINRRALEWFDIVKADSVQTLYDYFNWESEGDIPPYAQGIDPQVLDRTNRALARYSNAFLLDSLNIKFTGFSKSYVDNLTMVYELSGLSPDGLPMKHYVHAIFEFPIGGVYDLWLAP